MTADRYGRKVEVGDNVALVPDLGVIQVGTIIKAEGGILTNANQPHTKRVLIQVIFAFEIPAQAPNFPFFVLIDKGEQKKEDTAASGSADAGTAENKPDGEAPPEAAAESGPKLVTP